MFQLITQQPFFSPSQQFTQTLENSQLGNSQLGNSQQSTAVRVYNAKAFIMKTKRHTRFLSSLIGVNKTFYMLAMIK